MSKELQLSPVFAVEYSSNGVLHCSFYYDYVPHSIRVKRFVGQIHPVRRVFEISPVHWLKNLDELLALWRNGELEKDNVEVEETKATNETEAEARLRRLTTLDAIIRGGPQRSSEGEVAIARELFKRYSGKEWVQ